MKNKKISLIILVALLLPGLSTAQSKEETLAYMSNLYTQSMEGALLVKYVEFRTEYQTLVKIRHFKDGSTPSERFALKNANFFFREEKRSETHHYVYVKNSDGDSVVAWFKNESDAEKMTNALRHLKGLLKSDTDPFDSN